MSIEGLRSAHFFLNVCDANVRQWGDAVFKAVCALADDLGRRLDPGVSPKLDAFCGKRGLKWWVSTRWDHNYVPYGDEDKLVEDLMARFERRPGYERLGIVPEFYGRDDVLLLLRHEHAAGCRGPVIEIGGDPITLRVSATCQCNFQGNRTASCFLYKTLEDLKDVRFRLDNIGGGT